MIVDASALIAVLKVESDAGLYLDALRESPSAAIAAPTLLEASLVADGRGPVGARRLDQLVAAAALEVLPFSEEHASVARRAYQDFGRASGHPARLNVGDCMAYAVATVLDRPLLYKGDDFIHTDIRSALA